MNNLVFTHFSVIYNEIVFFVVKKKLSLYDYLTFVVCSILLCIFCSSTDPTLPIYNINSYHNLIIVLHSL